jgi:hypothetical protein
MTIDCAPNKEFVTRELRRSMDDLANAARYVEDTFNLLESDVRHEHDCFALQREACELLQVAARIVKLAAKHAVSKNTAPYLTGGER